MVIKLAAFAKKFKKTLAISSGLIYTVITERELATFSETYITLRGYK